MKPYVLFVALAVLLSGLTCTAMAAPVTRTQDEAKPAEDQAKSPDEVANTVAPMANRSLDSKYPKNSTTGTIDIRTSADTGSSRNVSGTVMGATQPSPNR